MELARVVKMPVLLIMTGFTPDVKIWEVEFGKDGYFQHVSRAMELKGHSAAALSLSFSGDSLRCVYVHRGLTSCSSIYTSIHLCVWLCTHRMATASKDGTWKFWNTDG